MPKFLIVAVLLLAAACASPATSELPQATTAQAVPVVQSSDERPMALASPLGEFFADNGGTEKSALEFTRQVEEAISLCMLAEGHRYIPSTPQVNEAIALQGELTELDWKTRFGYGIATNAAAVLRMASDTENSVLTTQMSETERAAWVQALAGTDADSLAEERPLDEQGCIGSSIIETNGAAAYDSAALLGTEYETGLVRVLDRDEMVAPMQEWRSCFASKGFEPVEGPEVLRNQLGSRLQSIGLAFLNSTVVPPTNEEILAVFDGVVDELDGVPAQAITDLRDLQRDEVAIAVADFECYLAHVQPVFEPLRDAYEVDFIDQNESALEALRDFG